MVFIRRRVFWKYTFYISMSILAIVNITFFLCHWGEWTPNLDKEAILLSVVGFFFAFAGINIYSIFNTNIESEKQALHDLKDKYDGELRMSAQMIQFPQELTMIWHTTQYLVSAKEIQSKSFDWLGDLKKRLKKLRDFVQGLRDNYQIEKHEVYRDDLANLAKGVQSVLNNHRKDIEDSAEFFAPIPNNKETYMSRLDDVIQFVEETITYNYEPEQPLVKLSLWKKTKNVYKFAVKTFKNNK